MGFFDSISELVSAAAPWATVEAEAPAEAVVSARVFCVCFEGGRGRDAEERRGEVKRSRDGFDDADLIGIALAIGIGIEWED
jgi:hypothetical protein